MNARETTTTRSPGNLLVRFCGDERGATSLEYAIMLAMMSIACITAFRAVGGTSGGAWGDTANKVSNAMK